MLDSKAIYDYIIKIQAISNIGLTFSKDPYSITNYREINDLSKAFLEDFLNVKLDRPNYFEKNVYPTPNVSVRTIIFNKERDKILMVREVRTQNYSLPGGWAELYDSPSETAQQECLQEAGAELSSLRLIGITNRTPYKNSTSVPEYVILFEGFLSGELLGHEYETDDVGWFPIDNLPEISRKLSMEELQRMIKAALDGVIIFD